MKKLLIISDLHCGHRVGLTPPRWQTTAKQRKIWQTYLDILREVGKPDILVVNGDAIDGKGPRSGGTEQISTDRAVQCEMAKICIEAVKAETILLTYGTPAHVGQEEDWELVVSDLVNGEIRDLLELNVEGIKFNIRHKVGSSSVPHGRHTAIARERLWNILWAEGGTQRKADVLIRSHVHYFSYSGQKDWLALTTPALRGLGDKYGSRQCSGTVDYGVVVFEIESGEYRWKPIIKNLKRAVRKPIKF